ncbi:Pycsar system effector family protein [Rasiella sp. SM2506]|uniref:Pycsar system effector family protein n=1 Tax=Rasiella sp. SM2506 TaxID=3423914 RepID=UPI003D7B21BA
MEKQPKSKANKEGTTNTTPSRHTEELVDHYWGSMNHVTSLIKASELKAGLILSFYGILLNFIYQSVGTLLATVENDIILYILIGLWFVTTAASIFYSVRCFIPKIEGKFSPNVFFFGDVISKFGDVKAFSKTFYEVSIEGKKLFEQLGEQIFIISKIAAWKFRNVKRSIVFLALGLVLLFITALYYVLLIVT